MRIVIHLPSSSYHPPDTSTSGSQHTCCITVCTAHLASRTGSSSVQGTMARRLQIPLRTSWNSSDSRCSASIGNERRLLSHLETPNFQSSQISTGQAGVDARGRCNGTSTRPNSRPSYYPAGWWYVCHGEGWKLPCN